MMSKNYNDRKRLQSSLTLTSELCTKRGLRATEEKLGGRSKQSGKGVYNKRVQTTSDNGLDRHYGGQDFPRRVDYSWFLREEFSAGSPQVGAV